MERHRALALAAADRLSTLGYGNVHVIEGDGSVGWPNAAPFDAIVVTAAGADDPSIVCGISWPTEGRLVMPVGGRRGSQRLMLLVRRGDRHVTEDLGGVRFVPLIGEQGLPG